MAFSVGNRLIAALDTPTRSDADALVNKLESIPSWVKIGLELYCSEGPTLVRDYVARGLSVMLDLKLHDIPTTVAKAVAAAGELGVVMLTVHTSGGRKMLEKAAASVPAHTLLLGVTVLTSSDEATLQETGVNDTVGAQATRLARLGVAAGIRGLIASPHELQSLRAALGDEVTIVTPGVRPKWAVADDQKRFSTPVEAVRNGADYLVIGRPVTGHPDPLEAVRAIARELA